jgi:hypothetical protein
MICPFWKPVLPNVLVIQAMQHQAQRFFESEPSGEAATEIRNLVNEIKKKFI